MGLGSPNYPPFHLLPRDVNDELRARLYKGKGNEGPKTHHIVFYYNFGTSAFGECPLLASETARLSSL